MQLTPTIAIVGRPNVGKSTLFNRVLGSRRAIVHDEPGVTRDRLEATGRVGERVVRWVDTGGLVPANDTLGINAQVLLAVEGSDLLLFVVDGREGLLAADLEAWDLLRARGRPLLLVINKIDTSAARAGWADFYRLGDAEPSLVSAEHGTGLGDLLDRVARRLPEAAPLPAGPTSGRAVAIVGRPNVGKSSLLNRLLGTERTLVSPVAGTTRDPIDTWIHRGDRDYLLVDTAGIRRRSQVTGTPEDLAVLLARRQIERAEVALLVVDARAGITSGDLAIAGAIWEAGRAAVVALNKWDLLDEDTRERLDRSWPRLAEVLADPPRVNVSAQSGRSVEKLYPAIDQALAAFDRRLSTAEVNRWLEESVAAHQPPLVDGKPWKLYYATQVDVGPPTVMLFANRTLPVGNSYRRYLENRLREALDAGGVPVRLVIRRKVQETKPPRRSRAKALGSRAR